MKIVIDFITNSSSMSFIIQNISNQNKSLSDFIDENREFKFFITTDDIYYRDIPVIKPNETVDIQIDQNNAHLIIIPNGKSKSFIWEHENLPD